MSGLFIKSISEQVKFGTEYTPPGTQVKQEWFVELAGKGTGGLVGLGTRSEVEDLLQSAKVLPLIRSIRPGYPRQYCTKVNFDQHEEVPNVWVVQAGWQTITNIAETQVDPTKRPALIDTGTYRYQKIPTIDLKGEPIVTTAGEQIVYNQQKAAPSYTLVKNLAEYPTYIGKDRDFVNKDAVQFLGMTFKPWELYIPEVNVSHLLYENDYPYYEFSCVIYANIDDFGWKTRLRNAGYHELKNIRSRKVRTTIYDENGNFVKYKWVQGGTFEYVAIQMGSEGRFVYPSSPVLLTPEGEAYREYTDQDKANLDNPFIPKKFKQTNGTGPVIGLRGSDWPAASQGITQKQYDAAVVEVTLLNEISFNSYLPFINDKA